MATLYVRAVTTLRRRGYEVPAGPAGGLVDGPRRSPRRGSPVRWTPSADDLVLAHMGQHLLIADLAAPFLLIGLRSPVYAFYLPRPLLVRLARVSGCGAPSACSAGRSWRCPVWVVILYGWHFSFAFEAALENPLLHVVQHLSFLFGALLVWWSVIEPKRRRLPGDLWKVPYLLGARLAGMFLGMALILLRSPAYAEYYGDRARDHGLSPLTDQQVAGGMMLGLDLLVMLFAVGFFFYRSAQEHDRAEQATVATG